MPMGLNISPAILQSYINAILSCLHGRKYCEAIMNDLLLFTPMKSSHFDKLEELLKALHKNVLKFLQRTGSYSKLIINTWVILFLLETKEYV